MSNYTIEGLCETGPRYAMAMLIECINSGEPFVTYGQIAGELEYQLNIDKIFPTHIGSVAGTLMNTILEKYPRAPLINLLVTRPNGIPGRGVGSYLAARYKNKKLANWVDIPIEKKKQIVENERKKIFKFQSWHKIYKELFGKVVALRKKDETEDYDPNVSGGRGGSAESDEHKRLKEWVAKNPTKIGLNKSFGKGAMEARLLSGDEVDVLFSDGNTYKTVEVKSLRSKDGDLQRGIYQCVKYREVKKAEHLPYSINVQSILVAERDLNSELKIRAKLLGVKFMCVSVNKK